MQDKLKNNPLSIENSPSVKGALTKYQTVNLADGKHTGSYSDSLKGKTLYLDKELYEKSVDLIDNIKIKKLTGTVVSSDPTVAAAAVVYYRNFNAKVFSVPNLQESNCRFMNQVIYLLVSNIEDSTIYEWSNEDSSNAQLAFPYSSEVEGFLSEITYLCKAYKDIDYQTTIIQNYSALTRYIFGYIYSQIATKESSKQFTISPEWYSEVERITSLSSRSTIIRGISTIAHLIYFVLKEGKGVFVDYLNYLRVEKSVNISRIRRTVNLTKGKQHKLLHEWNVVALSEELEELLGSDWSTLLRDQRKILDGFRTGKTTESNLDQFDSLISNRCGNEVEVIYNRQKKLHAYMKERRSINLDDEKRKRTKTFATITPRKTEWRNFCISKQDKFSLCTLTIPLIRNGYIKTEREIASFVMKGIIESSFNSIVWNASDIEYEAWYIALAADCNNDENPSTKSRALKIMSQVESLTLKPTTK